MSEMYYYEKYTIETIYGDWYPPYFQSIIAVNSISESYSISGYTSYNFENQQFNFRGLSPITISVQQGENNKGVYTDYYNANNVRYVTFRKILGDTRLGNLTINTYREHAYRVEHKSKGTYIETIAAEKGTYPKDGEQSGFWWVERGLIFPEMKIRLDNKFKTSSNGWVMIDNQLREIDKIYTKINDQIKEVI